MKKPQKFQIVLVTAPDLKVARKLAKAALTNRLAACANLVPALESHYWWQGRIETSQEVLVLFKTTLRRFAALEKLIVALHPYDTPEVVALTPDRINARYRKWWADSVG